jgi:hypothetical protein
MFELPTLLCDMFMWNDKKRLVDLLKSTDLNDEKQLMVVCTTLKMVLCDQVNDRRQRNEDFIEKCFIFVSKLAESKGIDHAKIEPGDIKLNRTLAIVDSIENLRRKVDFVTVRQNLKYCTYTIDLLGQTWFDNRIKRMDASHPLILLLNTKEPEGVAMLKYIDRTVEILRMDDPSKLGRVRRGFKAQVSSFQLWANSLFMLTSDLRMVQPRSSIRLQRGLLTVRWI